MNTTEIAKYSQRLLVIDDNPRIHEDIRKILCPTAANNELDNFAAALFEEEAVETPVSNFEIDSAYQGQEGLALVQKAVAEGRPYSLAFVDVRMPPGWDGVETIEHIWKKYPELQVVICTAYSDHSWGDIITRLGKSDSLLILKKPFDNVEVLQLAHALTKKWVVTRQAKMQTLNLATLVTERTEALLSANAQLRAEIDRRAEIEAALRESEERFHKSFESTLVALALLKADTLEHADVNASYLALLERSCEQVLGESPAALELLESPLAFVDAIRAAQAGQRVHNRELNFLRPNRSVRQALVSIVPLLLGSSQCLLVAASDVTEQRQLESQLRQSQKMEAIGQLAAGVAHDFNNLLTVIIGHASIQLTKAHLDQEVGRSLHQVKLAGERASGLTRQLLAFSRKQALQRKAVDVGRSVNTMRKMLSRLIDAQVSFEIECAPDVPCVLGDESNIEQVILNLVVNARDAMPQGGKLSLRVDRLDVRAPDRSRHVDAREGRFVVLTVTDTGCGMDAETQRRMYEPFFTTKPVGKGTGLGLSTIYGIIKQHEGWIELQSEVGVGTTFRIVLPATDEKPSTSDTAVIIRAEGDRRECILVVEDEPQVRAYVCDALRNHGYQVLDADCGQKALEVWANAKRKVDLLLTDMVMPNGMSGRELVKNLRQRQQDLKIIYMSGYNPEFAAEGDRLEELGNFLPKPFSQGKLFNMVDSALKSTVAMPAVVAVN
ncbi:MAG: response regulator [Verrucomicrobiota bacterium]